MVGLNSINMDNTTDLIEILKLVAALLIGWIAKWLQRKQLDNAKKKE